jgi:hypothetical protein
VAQRTSKPTAADRAAHNGLMKRLAERCDGDCRHFGHFHQTLCLHRPGSWVANKQQLAGLAAKYLPATRRTRAAA